MQISKNQIELFRLMVLAYEDCTTIPVKGSWKSLDNNNLWMRLIGQIMVVGSVTGKNNFDANSVLQKMVHIDSLKNLQKEELTININFVLRQSKVRYASEDLHKCAKTKAVVNNFQVLQNYEEGMLGILNMLNLYTGQKAELERVDFFKDNFQFMKNKSARDYLMGIGMNRNTLALDVRIRNIFNYVGIEFPMPKDLGNADIYNATEKIIIEKICNHLKIEPVLFDRILFQNYAAIIKGEFLIPKLF